MSKTTPTRRELPAGKARSRKATMLMPWGHRLAPNAPTLKPTPAMTAATAAPSSPITEELPESRSLVGVRIGNFVVESRIGQGGMGAVYLARNTDLDSLRVVIKILLPELSHQPELVGRFRTEAETASKICHPGIVHVEDFGHLESGEQYIVMEYLEGTDLAQRLREQGPLDLREVQAILEQVADALGAAHKRGIVHRDLKPANLFRLPDGRIKLLDFGIAKLIDDRPGAPRTRTGMVLGTPQYIAPEQAQRGAGHVTHLADVFALGIIAYELVTGERPWSGLFEAAKVRPKNPRTLRPELPAACANAILAALHPDPACRPQSAEEVARQFRDGMAGPRSSRSRRSLYLTIAAGGGALITAGILMGAALGGSDAAAPSTVSAGSPAGLHPAAHADVPAPRSAAPAVVDAGVVATEVSRDAAPVVTAPGPAAASIPSGSAAQATTAAPTKRVAAVGQVNIFSRQGAADVYIGGRFQGSTPITLTVPAGQFALEVRNVAYGTQRLPVTVRPGHETSVEIRWK